MSDQEDQPADLEGSCQGFECTGNCSCYEQGRIDGREEEAYMESEDQAQEVLDSLAIAIERIFSEELRSIEGKELFKGDPEAKAASTLLHRVLDKIRRAL